MGVPGLTHKARKYYVRVNAGYFSSSHIIVDGYSIGYYACQYNLYDADQGSYQDYHKRIVAVVEKLMALSDEIQFVFDGGLPQSKRPIRLHRSETVNRTKFAGSAAYEIIRAVFPSLKVTIAAGEADDAIAYIAHHSSFDRKFIVSTDSDFFTYRGLSSGVAMLNLLMSTPFGPRPQYYVCNIGLVHGALVFGTIRQNIPHKLLETPEPLEAIEFPKAHELVNSIVYFGRLELFLPRLSTSSDTVWATGKRLRSLAMARILKPHCGTTEVPEFWAGACRKWVYNELDSTVDVSQYQESAAIMVDSMMQELFLDPEAGASDKLRAIVKTYLETVTEYSATGSAGDGVRSHRLTSHNYFQGNILMFAKVEALVYSMLFAQASGIEFAKRVHFGWIDWQTFSRVTNFMVNDVDSLLAGLSKVTLS